MGSPVMARTPSSVIGRGACEPRTLLTRTALPDTEFRQPPLGHWLQRAVLAAVLSGLLSGLVAGCASDPEGPPPGTPQGPGQQAVAQQEDDSWWPSMSLFSVPKVHKIVVQQGNVITQQMVDRLKPGMTKAQAQYVMGRPVLDDLFDPNRWVYIYIYQVPDFPDTRQTLTLYFENDALVRFTGDFLPTPAATAAAAQAGTTSGTPAAATTAGAPGEAAPASSAAATPVPAAPAEGAPTDTSPADNTPTDTTPTDTTPEVIAPAASPSADPSTPPAVPPTDAAAQHAG